MFWIVLIFVVQKIFGFDSPFRFSNRLKHSRLLGHQVGQEEATKTSSEVHRQVGPFPGLVGHLAAEVARDDLETMTCWAVFDLDLGQKLVKNVINRLRVYKISYMGKSWKDRCLDKRIQKAKVPTIPSYTWFEIF